MKKFLKSRFLVSILAFGLFGSIVGTALAGTCRPSFDLPDGSRCVLYLEINYEDGGQDCFYECTRLAD
jgi:hypothetical protein